MAAPQAAEWAVKHLLSARINAVAEVNSVELHQAAWFVGMAAATLDGTLTTAIETGTLIVVPPTFISMKPVIDLVPNLEPALKDTLAMLVCWEMRDPIYTAYMEDASRSAILSTVTAEGAAIKRLVSYLQVGMEAFNAMGYPYPPDVQRISVSGDLHHLTADDNSSTPRPPPLVTRFTPRISLAETDSAPLSDPRHSLDCGDLGSTDVHYSTLADHMTRPADCPAPRISSVGTADNPCCDRRDTCRHPGTNGRARCLQRIFPNSISRECLRLPRSSAVEDMACDHAFRTPCLPTSLQAIFNMSQAFRSMTTRSYMQHAIRELRLILLNTFSYMLLVSFSAYILVQRTTSPFVSLHAHFNVSRAYCSATTGSRIQDVVRELRLILLNA